MKKKITLCIIKFKTYRAGKTLLSHNKFRAGYVDYMLESKSIGESWAIPGSMLQQGTLFAPDLVLPLKSTNGGTRGVPKISLAGWLRAIRGVGEFIFTCPHLIFIEDKS